MPRVKSQVARKDYPDAGIKKGDTYYSWKFRYGGKQMSKTYPRRSQLTRSAFLGQLYDLEDQISDMAPGSAEELRTEVEGIVSDLESMRDECQSSLDNMPEQLQDSSVLNERIEALDNAINEFEGIDLEYDEEDESYEDEDTWIEEKLSEVQGISIDCS